MKCSELVDGHRRKMSPNLGDFFSDKVFLGSTYANVPISTFRSPMKHSWKALEFLLLQVDLIFSVLLQIDITRMSEGPG